MSAAAVQPAMPGGVRAVALDIALNVALPWAGYAGLRHAGIGEPRALVLSALIPAAVAVASLVQRRRMNMLSVLVLAATALSLLATAWSGSAWFALVQPSFITGALSLWFAASLAASRPILFYLARDTTCPTAEAAAAFETNWSQPGFRRSMRVLTIVWAAFLGGEAAFRFALAAIWPSPALVASTQLLWIVLPVLLVRWSIRAGRRMSQSRQGLLF